MRRVFGRLVLEVAGEKVRFEMTKRWLEVRRWHKRQVKVVAFAELVNFTRHQSLLFPEEAK